MSHYAAQRARETELLGKRSDAYHAASAALDTLADIAKTLYESLRFYAPHLATHTWTLEVVHEALSEHVESVIAEIEGP